MLFGSIPLVIIAVLTFDQPLVWSGSFVAALLYQILLSEALGWCLWLYVLKTLPASTAGIATLATPVIAAVAAWAQLGERPAPLELVGMGLIVLALSLITLQAVRRRSVERPPAGQAQTTPGRGAEEDLKSG
jgi:drug/metabolite transporter (DMT)-like permease